MIFCERSFQWKSKEFKKIPFCQHRTWDNNFLCFKSAFDIFSSSSVEGETKKQQKNLIKKFQWTVKINKKWIANRWIIIVGDSRSSPLWALFTSPLDVAPEEFWVSDENSIAECFSFPEEFPVHVVTRSGKWRKSANQNDGYRHIDSQALSFTKLQARQQNCLDMDFLRSALFAIQELNVSRIFPQFNQLFQKNYLFL